MAYSNSLACGTSGIGGTDNTPGDTGSTYCKCSGIWHVVTVGGHMAVCPPWQVILQAINRVYCTEVPGVREG